MGYLNAIIKIDLIFYYISLMTNFYKIDEFVFHALMSILVSWNTI